MHVFLFDSPDLSFGHVLPEISFSWVVLGDTKKKRTREEKERDLVDPFEEKQRGELLPKEQVVVGDLIKPVLPVISELMTIGSEEAMIILTMLPHFSQICSFEPYY